MEKYKFSLPLRVRFAETDLQGHVFFGHYLTYFDEGLTGYTRALGCTYQDIIAAGLDFFYVRAECDFKSRVFFEEVLSIHARAGRIGHSSVTFEFSAFKEHNDELVATGKIVAVFIDALTKKPARVLDIFRDAVARYECS